MIDGTHTDNNSKVSSPPHVRPEDRINPIAYHENNASEHSEDSQRQKQSIVDEMNNEPPGRPHHGNATEAKHDTNAEISTQCDPKFELILSRPCYYRGDTLVGLVRCSRDSFASLKVFVTGKCRVDSRWHNTKYLSELYGTHPLLTDVADVVSEDNNSGSGTVVCFFATNCVELLSLPRGDDTCNDGKFSKYLFRVDLPFDLPHSANLTSCRYFYTAVGVAKSFDGKTVTVRLPFTLHSCMYFSSSPSSFEKYPSQHQHRLLPDNRHAHKPPGGGAARVKIGTCSAFPMHNEPCYISPMTLCRRSQLSIVQTALQNKEDVKSLRVTDQEGVPCCVLILVGSEVMVPGGRIEMSFCFQKSVVLSQSTDDDSTLKCLRIAASLHGVEMAIFDDYYDKGATKMKKTKTLVLDAAHRVLQHHCNTDWVGMTLSLPLDCPSTLSTDLVEICISCKIELTVLGKNGKEQLLRLELPVEVVHELVNVRGKEDDGEDTRNLLPVDSYVSNASNNTGAQNVQQEGSVEKDETSMKDIQNDLMLLNLYTMSNSNE